MKNTQSHQSIKELIKEMIKELESNTPNKAPTKPRLSDTTSINRISKDLEDQLPAFNSINTQAKLVELLNVIKGKLNPNFVKSSAFTLAIREFLTSLKENQPSPSKSPKPDVLEPDTDTPSKPERRRTLTPPKEAPKTRPKATNENEQELLNKIATKYRSLKSKK